MDQTQFEIVSVPPLPADLENMTVAELRKECAARSVGESGWRQTASKAALIAALNGGDIVLKEGGESLEVVIARAIGKHLNLPSAEGGKVDEAAVRVIVKEEIEAARIPRVLNCITPAGKLVEMDVQHFMFELVRRLANARLHQFWVGPAGAGKTHAAHSVAKSLDLDFGMKSVCQQTSVVELIGHCNATGYVGTVFRKCFEFGGLFLLDELDNGNPNVISVLNAALANSEMAFPDGMVKRHKDFVLIAAGNTYGSGPDRQYCGRVQLDAATLDRFVFLDFAYDEHLEGSIVGVTPCNLPTQKTINLEEGELVTIDWWFETVLRFRKAVGAAGLRVVISPRATQYGAKMIAAGIGRAWLERSLIRKGLDNATWAKIGGDK